MMTLGQSGSMSSMLFWILALIVVVVIGGAIIFTLRRRMLSSDDSTSVGSSGLLDHLHQMHKAGKLDDDEFARARAAILHQVRDDLASRQKPAPQKPAPKSTPGNPDDPLSGIDLDR